MAMTLEELLDKYPVDRAKIQEHKERMLAEMEAYDQRESQEVPRPGKARLDE
ncbi:hypothetical protein MUN78_08100 [Leucobacter allii]|uniref:Uncharacterized protein n=1 Tax=Leucobacter allii TaxID=2932247 RepID=A0ABY4FR52_9MICO|nr:hypothetical protein [Leucobacter allii]UOQ58766.1 hypothetical protein MUN78_08100 [Leucobacter allii]